MKGLGGKTKGLNPLRIAAVVRRQFYVQKRAPHRWFDWVVWPVVDTVIWGSIGLFVDQQGGPARSGTAYMLSGILLMHVLYQSDVSMATSFLEEVWSRNLLNLMVSPLREVELLAGFIITSMVRLVLGLGFVAVAAWALYAFDVTSAGLGLIPVIAVLMLVGWLISLLVITTILRFGTGAEILCWGLLFFVVALSGAFYPIESIPGIFQPLSRLLPSTYAFEAARHLLDGDPMPWNLIGQALAGLAIAIPLTLATLLWTLHLFRRRGYITRYS